MLQDEWSDSSVVDHVRSIPAHATHAPDQEAALEIYEPCHEIMVLSVQRKLILQTCMHSHPVGLDVWFLVRPFVYFHISCVRTAKALARPHGCAGSPKPSLVAYVISTTSHELTQIYILSLWHFQIGVKHFTNTIMTLKTSWDRQAWANNVDPDQTAPRKEQFDQGMHCLSFRFHLLDTYQTANTLYTTWWNSTRHGHARNIYTITIGQIGLGK